MAVRWRREDAEIELGQLAAENARLECDNARLARENRGLRRTVDVLRARVSTLEAALAKANATIREYRHRLFGRQSERGRSGDGHGVGQEAAAAGDPEGAKAEEPVADGAAPARRTVKRQRGAQPGHVGHGRRIQTSLPHVDQVIELSEAERQCPHCGKAYKPKRGVYATSVVLNWSMLVFYTRYLRQKYEPACTCPGATRTLTAPPPAKVIRRGLLSAQALARICVEKFWWGRPLHRTLAGLGLEVPRLPVSRGGVTGMLKGILPLLEPLDAAIRDHVREQTLLHGDETGATVHCPENDPERRADHRPAWWTWCFRATDAVAFVNDQHRDADAVFAFFGWNRKRPPQQPLLILLTDCYSAYKTVAGWVVAAYCWAHVRRHFLKAARDAACTSVSRWAETWRLRIGTLYQLDDARRHAVAGSPAWQAADQALRAHIAAIHHIAERQSRREDLLPVQAKVLHSLLRHWAGLTLFLDHPEVPLDNNEVERILRGPVVGRKNFRFFGSLWSATLAQMLWTILATAARNDLNPLTYLTAYLQACADNGGQPLSGEALARFLPWTMPPTDRAAWSCPLPAASTAHFLQGTPPPRPSKPRLRPRSQAVEEVDTS